MKRIIHIQTDIRCKMKKKVRIFFIHIILSFSKTNPNGTRYSGEVKFPCPSLRPLQGVHYLLCFFRKMLWFFWTMPVLLQRWCVYTHWHRGKTEKGQSPEHFKIFGKNTIFNEYSHKSLYCLPFISVRNICVYSSVCCRLQVKIY